LHIYTIQHNPTLPHAVSTKRKEKTIFDVTCMVLWSMSYVLYQKKRKAINLHKCIFLNDAMRKKKKLLPKFEKTGKMSMIHVAFSCVNSDLGHVQMRKFKKCKFEMNLMQHTTHIFRRVSLQQMAVSDIFVYTRVPFFYSPHSHALSSLFAR